MNASPGLDAIVAMRGETTIYEEFAGGFNAQTPHPIYSGTKSFWGTVALYASEDGLLTLDEPVAQTIPQWREDPWKRRVTVRMLLNLTAGLGFGGLGAGVPTYERACAAALRDEPGSRFQYGGVALQVFGAVLAQRLRPREMTPHEYLQARVLTPAGVTIAAWRTLADGTRPLPTGASLSTAAWLAYGRSVMRQHERLAPCFEGSLANPRYGLGWWLKPPGAPADAFYASGAAGQALYIVPSQQLLIVRFGSSRSFNHQSFLRRFFATQGSEGAPRKRGIERKP